MEKKLTIFTEDAEMERKVHKRAKMLRIIGVVGVAVVVAVFLVLLPMCGKNNHTVVAPTEVPVTDAPTEKPTEVPTEAPTEVPTEAPTPEPTEVPEGWYVDPYGVIPGDVEILVYDLNDIDQNNRWCITKVDGKATLQLWTKDGLSRALEVPEGMLKANALEGGYMRTYPDTISFYAYFPDEEWGEKWESPIYYLENGEGQYMYIESTSYCIVSGGILFGTTDGRVIWYSWGNNYYKVHDFNGADVTVDSDGIVGVNSSEYFHFDKLTYEKRDFSHK